MEPRGNKPSSSRCNNWQERRFCLYVRDAFENLTSIRFYTLRDDMVTRKDVLCTHVADDDVRSLRLRRKRKNARLAIPGVVSRLAIVCTIVLSGCKGEFAVSDKMLAAAERSYDRELLISSLNEIGAWHKANNTGVVELLDAGVDASAIDAKFGNSECQPTEELKALWSWRDGGVGATPFVWYHDYLPLEDALSQRRWLGLTPFVRWDPNYIPVFSFEGEWFAAYCGKGTQNAGPIVHYFLEDEPRVSFVNLTVFLASMAEAIRTDGLKWQDGAVQDDIRKMHAIHQARNPGYAFPYYVANID